MMTGKERAKLKKAINNEFREAEANIILSQLGEIAGANESENRESTDETRQIVVNGLEESKRKLREYLAEFEKDIDEAIAKMS